MQQLFLDKSGDLRKEIFYRFDVSLDDSPIGEQPRPDWIVVPRTPTDDSLESKGQETWMYVAEAGDAETVVQIKDCPADSAHITHSYYTKFIGDIRGGRRVSPLIPTTNFCSLALSGELRQRIEALKIRGLRVDPIDLTNEFTGEKVRGFWALQFVGRIVRRRPKPVDVPNRCPYCGKGYIVCESCGDWPGWCRFCNEAMVIVKSKHEGIGDRRIPFEPPPSGEIVEGKTWDGSDLLSSHGVNFSSKRFIDWLLRIHAAPFYAEPVYFCVDGMSDQQKKWFDDLQKPFEV